jgi:hypothetical protein
MSNAIKKYLEVFKSFNISDICLMITGTEVKRQIERQRRTRDTEIRDTETQSTDTDTDTDTNTDTDKETQRHPQRAV